jgi:hypothetical protein
MRRYVQNRHPRAIDKSPSKHGNNGAFNILYDFWKQILM